MDRRDFVMSAAAGAAAVGAMGASVKGAGAQRRGETFSMHFAPHFGMFQNSAGGDAVAQLEFAADAGFTAWEDNGMKRRSVEEQERIASAMDRLGMQMGVFVMNWDTAWNDSFAKGENKQRFVEEAAESVDVAKRVNATWMTVVCGSRHPRVDLGYQTANCVDMLRGAAEVLEPHGLVMVLEPLNPRDHPNMLLAEMAHAYEICRAVDSPSCKILCDLYHQQITEGNLIPNIDRSWDEIAMFQIGDNPGRKEPTTGEINYLNVFGHIKNKGYEGILGMEHGNSRGGAEGELAVIEAYRASDPG